MNKELPKGTWPVLLTPFKEDGNIDWSALDELLNFYMKSGTSGIFAVCLSSELFQLELEERFKLAKYVTDHCHIPVVASGNFGSTIEEQAASVSRMYKTGVKAVVVIVSLLVSAKNLDKQLLKIADLTNVPLGIYECPTPEHRLLSPKQIEKVAHSGKFVFMKDTCVNLKIFKEKVKKAQGTPLNIYQAKLSLVPDSIVYGAAGFCGIIANVAPKLCNLMCGGDKEAYNKLIQLENLMSANKYPASAKYMLQKQGLLLTTECRTMKPEEFTQKNRGAIDRDFYSIIHIPQ